MVQHKPPCTAVDSGMKRTCTTVAHHHTSAQDLGIMDAKAELEAVAKPCQLKNVPKRIVRKLKAPADEVEIRRSSRERPKVHSHTIKTSDLLCTPSNADMQHSTCLVCADLP